MKEPGTQFEGPRRIRRHERSDGTKLFELCFGHPLASDQVEDVDIEEEHSASQDEGWIVMLPVEGPYQGKPVSQIGIDHHQVQFSGCRLQVGSIGGVSTHPDFRGLGLAGRVLTHCTQLLKEEGARLMLISGMRGLYTRTGNVPAMRFHFFQLLAGSSPHSTHLPEVILRPYTPADLSVCARIYQSEAVGYLRSLEDYPASFSSGTAWIVEMDALPAAYLLLHVPWEHRDGPERRVREVFEYAGSRLALAAGFARLLDEESALPDFPPLSELRLSVPWQDTDLVSLLQPTKTAASLETLGGHTMRLINFHALQADLEPYITARLPLRLRSGLRFEQSGPLLVDPDLGPHSADRCAISWENHRLELGTADMTRLVFGDWDTSEFPPLSSLPIGSPLLKIIEALFPLPSFQPGLNFR